MGHSATQPAPQVPTYDRYPAGFPAKFVAFHDAYHHVYEGIVKRARALKARGFRNVGIRYLFEDQRYSEDSGPLSESILYGLDNNLAAYYARLIEAQEADLKGFFRMRRTGDEIALPDPLQVSMEFD